MNIKKLYNFLIILVVVLAFCPFIQGGCGGDGAGEGVVTQGIETISEPVSGTTIIPNNDPVDEGAFTVDLPVSTSSAMLMPCELDEDEQCIQITLPCAEESVYGKAGWYGRACKEETIQIPNGRPIYAFLVSGFEQNRNLDMFHFYNFAKCLLNKRAYVHYAWWNNLLAPYMKKPLHNNASVPSVGGALDTVADYTGFLYDPNKLTPGLVPGTYISGYPTKAIPAEDYQFQKDAKTVLEAIRENNPDAAIILVGHSMGGDSVIRIADSMPDDFEIDMLAPIDPVGNRTCLPNTRMEAPAQMTGLNTTCDGAYNFTRFQATHYDWFWWPYRISFENKNINYLYHRWQNEFAFPFDWECPQYNEVLGIRFRDAGCPLQAHMLTLPLDESDLPGAYFFRYPEPRREGINEGSTNIQAAIHMNDHSGTDVFPDSQYYWNWGGGSDGHGEIVGFRALKPDNGLESYPLALEAQGDWPSRSKENCDSDDLRPIDCERVRELKQWEADPEYLENNDWAPQKPPKEYCDERNFAYDGDYCTYCMVSGDLCEILKTEVVIPDIPVNSAPVADAGPDQIIECSGPNGTEVTLDGSGATDPDGDPLTFTWTGPFGTWTGETITPDLPWGTHVITLTVDDGRGKTDTDTVEVTVMDSTPPTLSVSLSPDVLWPPNHKMVPATVSVSVSDVCDPEPVCKIVEVSCNEVSRVKTKRFKEGDWKITGDLTLEVRAERNGNSPGRVYSINVECVDSSGNTSRTNTEIRVPHDMRKR